MTTRLRRRLAALGRAAGHAAMGGATLGMAAMSARAADEGGAVMGWVLGLAAAAALWRAAGAAAGSRG